MVAQLATLFLIQVSAPDWNTLASKRDVAGLEASASADCKGKFNFLRGMGAFGVGRTGWKAHILETPAESAKFVVFTSALTTQDYGEQIFELKDGRLIRYVSESDTLGYRIRHADFKVSNINTSEKSVEFDADVEFSRESGAGEFFFIRLGDNYSVKSVMSGNSKVKFAQAGGVLCVPGSEQSKFRYQIQYSGVVNRPQFAGATTQDEMMLTNDYWWPSIGRNPLTYSLTASIPENWEVVAQGERVSSSKQDGLKSEKFVMNVPISYLSLSFGDYKVARKEVNGREYLVWSREMTDEEMNVQLELNPPIIEFFDSIHPYPFQQWGSLVTKLYGGGALEAYSYATYGTGWLPDEDAHEPSHTWFGGIAPNTYLLSFWNESFAAFSEGWYAREGSIGNKDEKRLAFVKSPMSSRAYESRSVWDTGADAGGIASALGYGKGADVLQQLEYEMGREPFKLAVQRWLKTRSVGEPAEWNEFARACGSEWDWFFDEWLKRPGYPEFEVSNPKYGNGTLQFDLAFKSDPYRMKLDVFVESANEREIKEVLIIPKSGEQSVTVEIPVSFQPELISLDPYDRLLGPGKPVVPQRFSSLSRMPRYYQEGFEPGRGRKVETIPTDLDQVVIVGEPEGTPELLPLLKMSGFEYKDGKLSYKGTTVDLKHGGAVGVVELGGGKRCGFQVGRFERDPNVGNAQVALVDGYGRFLRGHTAPRRAGPLVMTLSQSNRS